MGNKDEDKPAENENENVDEKDDEKGEEEGKKEESSEDKDRTEPWVKLTEEEVATARSEVDKEVKGTDETLATEVKC